MRDYLPYVGHDRTDEALRIIQDELEDLDRRVKALIVGEGVSSAGSVTEIVQPIGSFPVFESDGSPYINARGLEIDQTSGLSITDNNGDAKLTLAANALLDGDAHSDTVAQGATKGSLIVGNDTPAWDELAVGTDGHVLTADSTQTKGVKWAAASGGGSSVDTGAMVWWGTNSAPTGYLMCDGSAVSRTTYSALFAVIGTTFGAGDGSTTFNVPDARGRFILAKAASGTGNTLAGTGGSLDHTHTVDPPNTTTTASSFNNDVDVSVVGVPTSFARDTHTHDVNIASFSSGSANPAYLVLNLIIKT